MVTLLLTSWGLTVPQEPTPWLFEAALACVCLAVASLSAHAGSALLVYSPTKLARHCRAKGARDHGQHGELIAHLQACGRQYEFLSWGLAMINIVACFVLLEHVASATLGWPLVLVGGLATAFLCAALPVSMAATWAERLVLVTLPVLRILRRLLYPVVVPMMSAARASLRALRAPQPASTPEEIADEIMAAVTDSASENALEEQERDWIENIVEMKDQHVSEAMTPRTDVIAFDASLPLKEAVTCAIDTGFSRYPVYEETVDRVIGVFYAKDALARLGNGGDKQVAIRELMREPLFVPESMGVVELLQRFKTTKKQMAIVLDEYGGTAGLISVEDILEEIIGDIADEFDAEEEEPIKVISEDRVIEISGRARVNDVNEVLGCEIPENPSEYDTVAGYVFTILSKIPEKGETLEVDGLQFLILESDDRRIRQMRVTFLEPQTSDQDP